MSNINNIVNIIPYVIIPTILISPFKLTPIYLLIVSFTFFVDNITYNNINIIDSIMKFGIKYLCFLFFLTFFDIFIFSLKY